MLKKYLGTAVLITVVVVLLTVLAFYVRTGATADSVAVLRTTGMTCGSCAEKISKAMARVSGVAVTEVDVAGGWVMVGYAKQSVKPEALAQKVRSLGFRSDLYTVVTPEQFRQITGRNIGQNSGATSKCCGGKGCQGG